MKSGLKDLRSRDMKTFLSFSYGANYMESPGEYLKRERELRGIRLEVISDATKIRAGLLAAIEKNDFDALPAAPFVKGFIQAYCKYLGLDVQDALLRYEAYMRSIAESKTSALKQGAEAKKQETRPANSLIPIISIAVIAVLLILFGLYAISKKRPLPVVDSSLPHVDERPSGFKPQPENEIAQKKEIASPSLKSSILTLAIEAEKPSWLKVEIDGQNPFEVSLKQGEKVKWNAKEKF
ncbi:MAG: helix-turn-helix domain-containing protein, partial [Deltaproteobacteria bacterium]|nr:helix-turn-helix domain-containing protein [Deltaproteobacteria bacterium]